MVEIIDYDLSHSEVEASSYLLVQQSLADGLGSPRDRPGFVGFSHCYKSSDE